MQKVLCFEVYFKTEKTYVHPFESFAAIVENKLEEDEYEDLYQNVDVGFFQDSEVDTQPSARFQNGG